MKQIDLNCDLGEGGDDAALIPLVSSINIACGGHAGDEMSMRRAVELAVASNVNIGAHPSYDDRDNFGRVERNVPTDELRKSLEGQIRSLKVICDARGERMCHVKPHGALYNVAVRNPTVARTILDAVAEMDETLRVITLPHGCLWEIAEERGMNRIAEGFADRTYQPDGTLTPRSDPHALHVREMDAADQVLWMVRDGVVRCLDGTWIPMPVQTVCVHGDGRSAVATLRLLRSALAAAGIHVSAF